LGQRCSLDIAKARGVGPWGREKRDATPLRARAGEQLSLRGKGRKVKQNENAAA